MRFTLYDRELRARRRMTSTVVAADADGATYDHHVDSGTFEVLDPRVVLPPTPDSLLGATLRERRDPRGRRAGRLQLTHGTEAQRVELRQSPVQQTLGAPRLPEVPVEVGAEWRGPGRWAFRLGDVEGDPRRELVHRVTAVDEEEVVIAIRGAVPVGDARLVVEGELTVDPRDATIGHGRVVGTVEGDARGLGGYEIAFRTAREAPNALPPWELRDAAIPRSRVFEGDACVARIEDLAARFDNAPAGRPMSTGVQVPTVDRGADVPWGSNVTITAEGYRVAQAAMDLEGVVAHVETLARNAQVLEPGREGPIPIVLVAAADVPASRVLDLVARVPEASRAFSLAVRLAEPPALPPIYAAGTPEALETLARGLTTRELASLAVGTCGPVVAAFTESASLGPEALWTHHRVAIPAALRECGCAGVDVDLLDATLQRIVQGERDPALRVLPIPANPRALRLGRRATVAELARVLAAR